MSKNLLLVVTGIIFFTFALIAECTTGLLTTSAAHFKILPLGTSGGELQDNLSSYLVSSLHSNAWIALDAGTLCSSIKKIPLQEFENLNIQSSSGKTLAESFFRNNIKAYLISHAHLDHIAGMVVCLTIDSNKEIVGTATTINYLRDDIFNWKIWPNFADEGIKPRIRKYHYLRLSLGVNTKIFHTPLTVTAFILNHDKGYPSTAFMLEDNGLVLLYFGDTGADVIEHSQDIHKVWQAVVPYIKKNKLSAIFIEASYPNQRPNNLLFGHLTPYWLLKELNELATMVNPKNPQIALVGLKIIITHIKQGLGNTQMSVVILNQLQHENKLGVQFIIPKQNQLMYF